MSRVIHKEPHPLGGQIVVINSGSYAGSQYRVEDWWDRVSGVSWVDADSNPAALDYAIRRDAIDHLPFDNNVLYGKVGSFGKLIHESEIEVASSASAAK